MIADGNLKLYKEDMSRETFFFLIFKISLSGYVQEALTRMCGGGYGEVTGLLKLLWKAKGAASCWCPFPAYTGTGV